MTPAMRGKGPAPRRPPPPAVRWASMTSHLRPGFTDAAECCGCLVLSTVPPRTIGSAYDCPLHGRTRIVAVGVLTGDAMRKMAGWPGPPIVDRPRDPNVVRPDPTVITHPGHLFPWRRRRCRICTPLPIEDDRKLDELLRTDPREWVRQAEEAFDEQHRERLPGEPPRPPSPDPGERAKY